MRATGSAALRRFFVPSQHAARQLADSVLHAHGEQGAPANPPPRLVMHPAVAGGGRWQWRTTQRTAVAAELLSSEGGLVAPPIGGLAGVCSVGWLEASVLLDAVLMEMQMLMMVSRRPRRTRRWALRRPPIPAMTANASLADSRPPAAVGERPGGEADSTRSASRFACRSSRQERRQGRAGNGSGRGRTVMRGARYRRAFSMAAWS